jgi:hypothetical protein
VSDWWTGIAATEITVPCGGEDHRILWERGRVIACDHGDVDDERTLATLGATPFECIELAAAWERRRHDLRTLVVGPRGGGDELYVDPDDPAGGRVRSARRRRRGGGGSGSGVSIGMSARSSSGGQPGGSRFSRSSDADERDVSDLIALVGLGAGFGERLVATVAAEWTTRLREGGSEAAEALPRLQAALYGRVFAALRSWLGETQLALELEMTDVAQTRSLTRVEGVIHARLPFAWLLDVWSRDLATVQGRFCLDAQPRESAAGEHWELAMVAPDLRTTEWIELRISPVAGV